jgi:hypothetical protein
LAHDIKELGKAHSLILISLPKNPLKLPGKARSLILMSLPLKCETLNALYIAHSSTSISIGLPKKQKMFQKFKSTR